MSGMAQYLHKKGYCITGSDRQQNDRTEQLSDLGIKIYIGHQNSNVGNSDMVVHTSAVHNDNEEIVEAKKRNIPVVLREQMLGAIFNSFKTRIAVCGTHGKTTVTAMIHEILACCGVSHCAFIGGVYHGNNFYYGNDIVVAEACEFNRSFLNLNPTICVCVNAEFDHPDCYKDEQDIFNAFERFINNTDNGGSVVLPKKLSFLRTERKRVFNRIYLSGNVCLHVGIFKSKVAIRHSAVNKFQVFAVAKRLRSDNTAVNKRNVLRIPR